MTDIQKIKAALKPIKDRLDDRTKFEEATYGKDYKASDDFETYVPIGYLRRAAEAYAALEAAAQGLIDKPVIEGGGVELSKIKNQIKVWEELAMYGETDPMSSMLKALKKLVAHIEALSPALVKEGVAVPAEVQRRVMKWVEENLGDADIETAKNALPAPVSV